MYGGGGYYINQDKLGLFPFLTWCLSPPYSETQTKYNVIFFLDYQPSLIIECINNLIMIMTILFIIKRNNMNLVLNIAFNAFSFSEQKSIAYIRYVICIAKGSSNNSHACFRKEVNDNMLSVEHLSTNGL